MMSDWLRIPKIGCEKKNKSDRPPPLAFPGGSCFTFFVVMTVYDESMNFLTTANGMNKKASIKMVKPATTPAQKRRSKIRSLMAIKTRPKTTIRSQLTKAVLQTSTKDELLQFLMANDGQMLAHALTVPKLDLLIRSTMLQYSRVDLVHSTMVQTMVGSTNTMVEKNAAEHVRRAAEHDQLRQMAICYFNNRLRFPIVNVVKSQFARDHISRFDDGFIQTMNTTDLIVSRDSQPTTRVTMHRTQYIPIDTMNCYSRSRLNYSQTHVEKILVRGRWKSQRRSMVAIFNIHLPAILENLRHSCLTDDVVLLVAAYLA